MFDFLQIFLSILFEIFLNKSFSLVKMKFLIVPVFCKFICMNLKRYC